MHKQAKGPYTASGLVSSKAGWYFGFTCKTGGTNFDIYAWDAAAANVGQKVEDFSIDANKKTDGHEHAVPIYCSSGLYIGVPSGSALFYYTIDPLKN